MLQDAADTLLQGEKESEEPSGQTGIAAAIGARVHNVLDFGTRVDKAEVDLPWVEAELKVGRQLGVVAHWDNIPEDQQEQANGLVAEMYRTRLFQQELYQATLVLLSRGVLAQLPGRGNELEHLTELSDNARRELALYDREREVSEACEFVTHRNPDDLVVLVMNGNGAIHGTMTLYTFNREEKPPSSQYLEFENDDLSGLEIAVEVGRLAISPDPSLTDMDKQLGSGIAYVVGRDFLEEIGFSHAEGAYVVGDAHGSLINVLRRRRRLPLTVSPSRVSRSIFNNGAAPVKSYFLTRDLLKRLSFEEIVEAVGLLRDRRDQDMVLELLNKGFGQLGTQFGPSFKPERFGVEFFHFPFNDKRTIRAFRSMRRQLRIASAVK